MKKDIHPNYVDSTVTCACGNKFETQSTKEAISVEVCSSCHPFYTGAKSLASQTGKVERFKQKYGYKSTPADPKKSEGPIVEEAAVEEVEEQPTEEVAVEVEETTEEVVEEPAEEVAEETTEVEEVNEEEVQTDETVEQEQEQE